MAAPTNKVSASPQPTAAPLPSNSTALKVAQTAALPPSSAASLSPSNADVTDPMLAAFLEDRGTLTTPPIPRSRSIAREKVTVVPAIDDSTKKAVFGLAVMNKASPRLAPASSTADPQHKTDEGKKGHIRNPSSKIVTLHALINGLLTHVKDPTLDTRTSPCDVLELIKDKHFIFFKNYSDEKVLYIPAVPLDKKKLKETERAFLVISESTKEIAKFQVQYMHVDYAQKPPLVVPQYKLPEVNARNGNFMTESTHPYQLLVMIFQGLDPNYELKAGVKIKNATAASSATAATAADLNPMQLYYLTCMNAQVKPASAAEIAPKGTKAPSLTLNGFLQTHCVSKVGFQPQIHISDKKADALFQSGITEPGITYCKSDHPKKEECLIAMQLKKSFMPVLSSVDSHFIFRVMESGDEALNDKMYLHLVLDERGVMLGNVMCVDPNSSAPPYSLETTVFAASSNDFAQSLGFKTLTSLFTATHMCYQLLL